MSDTVIALSTLKSICLCGMCTTGANKDGGCAKCERKITKDVAIEALEKQVPKLAEFIDLFKKFQCPSCLETYDACYDEETGEPSLWFNHCPECGQRIATKDWSDSNE